MNIKVKFERYDLEEFDCALRDCQNILYEIAGNEGTEQFDAELLRIIRNIGELAIKFEKKLDYENLTKEDIESIKADEEYAEAKERWEEVEE